MSRIHDMDVSQRPRERMLANGAKVLSDAELLAVLMRTGRRGHGAVAIAHELLRSSGGLLELSRLELSELLSSPGIGPAKAASLAAALELGRRLAVRELENGRDLGQPDLVGPYLARRYQSERREVFGALMLDRRHRLLACHELSLGTSSEAPVDPAELFRRALLDHACGLIVYHNHPSGELTPSADDLQLTARLVAAGRMIGVPLLDHLVLAGARWLSLRATRVDLFGTS